MHRSLLSVALALAFAGFASLPACAAPAAAKAAPKASPEAPTQLPRGVRPLHYDIALVPDAQNARFSAQAAIDIEITAPASSITLNAADLAFRSATLAPETGAPLSARIAIDAKAQTATFSFAGPLARGRYRLDLDYSGVIGSQAVGLFSLDYDAPQGKRRGVRSYMRDHAYGNTASNDLWRQVERAAAKPVTAIAHDFTLQPGVPLIRVGEPLCKGGSMTVGLSQGEFSRDQPARKPLTWRVPVIAQAAGARTGAPGQARTLVAGGKGSLTLPGCGPVVVNAGQSGYYRTLYSQSGFAQLAAQCATLAPIDQLGMLADTWALGMAGLQPASNFLDLAAATPAAADPQVWALVASGFGSLHAMYGEDQAGRARLDAHAVKRLAPVLEQIGWNARADEPTSHANLRAQLIDTLSQLGDQATIAEARRRYAAMGTDPAAVPGALRKTIMAVVAEHADQAAWEGLRRAAQAEKSPMIKDTMYGLLAASDDRALAERALALALTEEPGATNGAAMIATVSRTHPELAFDFALANLEAVNERVDATSRSRYLPGLAGNATTPAMMEKVRAYAEAHIAPEARRDAETTIAAIGDRIKVRRERLPEIDAWLAHNLK